MKTAVLVDGGFFIKRYWSLCPEKKNAPPSKVVRALYAGVLQDLRLANKNTPRRELYRILFYDCKPIDKRLQNPVTGKGFNTVSSPEAQFRLTFHEELKRQRKVALRLGHLGKEAYWIIKPAQTKRLLSGKLSITDLTESDVKYDVRQKGVDMKIGLDIASLAYKRSVDQIILIAGDADFVPAAKLARREGIDFVLDPMWNPIDSNLHEHIDGLVSSWPRPNKNSAK